MGIDNEKVDRYHISSWESYFKLSTDWERENGKVRLLEDVEVTVYFSLVTSLSDSCCLWMQNSCWVLKLYSRKVAGPDSSWVGRPWDGFLFTRCPVHPCSLRLAPWWDGLLGRLTWAGAHGLGLAWCTHLAASAGSFSLFPVGTFLWSGGLVPWQRTGYLKDAGDGERSPLVPGGRVF